MKNPRIKEQITKYKVGDVVRMETGRGFRVWRIYGILLGAVGQENLICLRTLDKRSGEGFGHTQHNVFMPMDIFEECLKQTLLEA